MIPFLLTLIIWSLRALLKSGGTLVIENLALRQQLAAYARCQKRVHVQHQERMFWATLSKVWASWRSALIIVKPATVIAWHRRGFQRYWRWRSRKPGRPPTPREHMALIRRISTDHPEWGEDRIAEELAIKLGVHHSTSTIRKYMVSRRKTKRRSNLADLREESRKANLRLRLTDAAYSLLCGRLHFRRDGDCLAPNCTHQRDDQPMSALG